MQHLPVGVKVKDGTVGGRRKRGSQAKPGSQLSSSLHKVSWAAATCCCSLPLRTWIPCRHPRDPSWWKSKCRASCWSKSASRLSEAPLSRGHALGRDLLLSPTLTSTPTRLNYSQFGHGGDAPPPPTSPTANTPTPVSNNLSSAD